jgi:tetratricopeptide (TPR) repeat protein
VLSEFTSRLSPRIGDSLAVEVLAMERRMWGHRHPRVASALYRLGAMHVDQGRFMEAEPLYQEALDIQIAFHGDQTTPVAEAYNNLGWWRAGSSAWF